MAAAELPSVPPSFVSALAEFVGQPPGRIGLYMIHLPRATEREENIRKLQEVTGPLQMHDAAEGAEVLASGHPAGCPFRPGETRSAGELGCLVSHVEVCRKALAAGHTHAVIFEDDCVPSERYRPEYFVAYLRDCDRLAREFGVQGTRDILLLSSSGCYDMLPITIMVKATSRFNGSHAILLSRDAMEKLVGSYEFTTKKGVCIPADGLYCFIAKVMKRAMLCPSLDTNLFVQNRTTGSYVLDTEGKQIRTA